MRELEGHARKVNDIIPGNGFIFSSSDDNTIAAWNPKVNITVTIVHRIEF